MSKTEAEPFGAPGTVVGDWVDSLSGYRVVVLVGPLGALNGYVGVPEGHPWHGIGYSQCTQGGCGETWCDHRPEALIDVHGGVTYSGWGVDPLETTGLWWFGFDCVHAGDHYPGRTMFAGDVLRSPEWVAAEATRMAHQLALHQAQETL